MKQTLETSDSNSEDQEIFGEASMWASPIIIEQARRSAQERAERLRHHASVAGKLAVFGLLAGAAVGGFRGRHA